MKFERVQLKGGGGSDGGGSYLKIEDNGSVNGILRGDVLKFYQDWPKGGEKLIFDKPAPRAKPRFLVNFIVHEGGKFVAKIWEFPPTVSNMLADIAEAYDLSQTKIKITKHVQGKQTSYMILPLANEKLSPKHLKEIDAVELNTLSISPTETGPKAPLKNYAPSDDSGDIPF